MDKKYMFRDLREDEIECRVAQAKETGVSLLLYKDARCDQIILDETVGPMNWQRRHCRDNANCVVSIWDNDKQMWIDKEDTGTESNTEKEKGLASDSFKRACFNWGIGRELYSAPFIWVSAEKCTALKQNGQKWQCYDRFVVEKIAINHKRITELAIRNAKSGKRCFVWQKEGANGTQEEPGQFRHVEGAPPLRCQRCSKEITAVTFNNKRYSPEMIAGKAVKSFGSELCWDCSMALQTAKEGEGA